jgi:hypothetical protein
MRFAKIVFLAAGIWGLLTLTPMYFLIDRVGVDTPPPIAHPEFYYGFLGVALAWQFAFFLIGSDPARYRPLMPVAMFEKFGYVIAAGVLFAQGRLAAGGMLFGAAADLVLGTLFVAVFVRTRAHG